MCWANFVSGSDFAQILEVTHKLNGSSCSILSVIVFSITGKWLTIWMDIQPIMSVVPFSLNTGQDSDSLAGWVFSQSHEWFISDQLLESGLHPIFQVTSLVKFTASFCNVTSPLFKKNSSGFNNLSEEMPHTYCQHYILIISPVIQQDIGLTIWTTCESQSAGWDHN